jgi:UDP-glucuronate decarboxylase
MITLVTGAAGFLGSHLSARLLADGHEVVGLDNLHSGQQANIDWLSAHPRFRFVRHDVVKPYDIPCDLVCNLACPASPPHYQADPVYTSKIAFLGTLHALENAQRHKAGLLQASTSEIYGDPLVHPQPESYQGNVNTLGPRACYDEGKRIGETLCADFTRLGRVDARLVRIFNTYGPQMRGDDGRVVTNFIAQALAGQALTIYGEGDQTRSFCYVDDLIEGIVRVFALPSNPGPINLGNPVEFTMLELAAEVQRLTGSQLPLVRRPLPADDPKQRQPDITKARRLLGWEPKVPLAAGLARTIDYFRALGPR